MQVFAPEREYSLSARRPGFTALFRTLGSLSHLQVLRVKLKTRDAGNFQPAKLFGLSALKALVVPSLTVLDIDAGLPPVVQVGNALR